MSTTTTLIQVSRSLRATIPSRRFGVVAIERGGCQRLSRFRQTELRSNNNAVRGHPANRQHSTLPKGSSAKDPYSGRYRETLRGILLKPRTFPVPRWISPRHFTFTLSEVCGHSSFLLVAISYAVDDHIQLRVIAVAGSAVMLLFTYFHIHGRVLWLPFKWNALFIAINLYRIGKYAAHHYLAGKISPELQQIHKDHFYALDPPDFARLVRLGTMESFQPNDVVVKQGEMNPYVRLVIDGNLVARRDGQPTYNLEEGNFVSECGLHAGLLLPGRIESCCTIKAKENCRTLRWHRNELMDLLERETSFRRALKAVLSWDIVRKLKGQRQLLASGVIPNAEEWTIKRNDQNQHRYAAILQNVLSHPQYMRRWKDELENYRVIHRIDDTHHQKALEACGWTVDEFERGHKDGVDTLTGEDDDDLIRHDWKWLAHDIYMRVFG